MTSNSPRAKFKVADAVMTSPLVDSSVVNRPDTSVSDLPGRVDEGEAWEEAVPIQTEMALGGGLVAAMFGPIQAGGDELNRRGIHDVDGGFEAVGQLWAAAPRPEGGRETLEVGRGFSKRGGRSRLAVERPLRCGWAASRRAGRRAGRNGGANCRRHR